MITCNFGGGLGNNLFQLATVYSISKKFGYDLKIPRITSRIGIEKYGQSTKLELDYLFENRFEYDDSLINKLKSYSHIDNQLKSYNYTPIPIEDNTCYSGYFQSHKYFLGVDIQKEFILRKNNIEVIKDKYNKIFDKKTISLHFRLGGDRNTQHMQVYHKNLSIDYYKKALNIIKYNPDEYNIVAFTDNMSLCGDYLKNLNYPINLIDNKNNNVLDFTFMSLCDINIVGNSTFSWWSAYLNQNQNNKIIVTESEWFGPGYKHFDLKDAFPKEWIRL